MQPPRPGGRSLLTTAEHTVLALIAAGMNDQEVGRHFGTTTIGGTRRAQKTISALGAAGRIQAVDVGCRTRLLTPPTDPRDVRELVEPHDLATMTDLTHATAVGQDQKQSLGSHPLHTTVTQPPTRTERSLPSLQYAALAACGVDLPPHSDNATAGPAPQDCGALQP
ncbi:hypothetical protein GCM10009639_19580 [Kitasatospora putterlickiae]|uniref:HTH luxR-type domain-containing protein n=1 Tax=Kitasatospora putterlickiae TaxID=221725 RepID=A0ABN1XUP1_9ACTN